MANTQPTFIAIKQGGI
ncbi:hypothetical protein E2I00_008143 [Balaenoptera physalus]|uniref:Uncharacterized protein n=1 Tax=Balaenoptera physalus TaxID=9770 RepID=A0A643BR59_BALPH|nr:hypothetical protein E2I00_008143 [Balaenoptera physalus]